MKKIQYIAPAINVVRVNTGSMIAQSLTTSSSAAIQDNGMEVKEDRGGWDDEW